MLVKLLGVKLSKRVEAPLGLALLALYFEAMCRYTHLTCQFGDSWLLSLHLILGTGRHISCEPRTQVESMNSEALSRLQDPSRSPNLSLSLLTLRLLSKGHANSFRCVPLHWHLSGRDLLEEAIPLTV
jgi:hypothetical protein